MKTLSEIKKFMESNGYSMEEASSGYFYCVKTDDNGISKTIWMDSACEDAYDIDNATVIVYDVIMDMM